MFDWLMTRTKVGSIPTSARGKPVAQGLERSLDKGKDAGSKPARLKGDVVKLVNTLDLGSIR